MGQPRSRQEKTRHGGECITNVHLVTKFCIRRAS